MTFAEFQSLLPIIISATAGLIVLMLGAAKVSVRWLFRVTLIGLVAGMVSLWIVSEPLPQTIGSLLTLDPLSTFFLWLLYGSTVVVALFAKDSLIESIADADPSHEIFYSILLFSLTGMATVATATHLAAFFLGLEIYTIGLYVLIGYRDSGIEASVKYLILGAISSGFILLGIAFLYLEFGTLHLTRLAQLLVDPAGVGSPEMWLIGTALLFVGVGFKLSLVPFHMWAPDVYQGAPTAVAAWIATASKGAVVAVVIRYLSLSMHGPEFIRILEILVIASIVIGNLLALYQTNLKRLLAYSSIAHLGYCLVPLCIGGAAAWSASTLYLVTYMVTVLGAFGLIIAREDDTNASGELANYRGLVHTAPAKAIMMAVVFFSLAGIPMTAGFIGKWSIFQVALSGERYLLAGAIVLGASLGVFYYLRVVATLYFSPAEEAAKGGRSVAMPVRLGLAVSIVGIFAIGLYPEPLLQLIAQVTGTLSSPEVPLILISQP